MHREKKTKFAFNRKITSRLRILPSFIIIGAMRCGTSSLYNYLIQHPSVYPAIRKEIHYFDWNFGQKLNWYRAHFPTIFYKLIIGMFRRRRLITGEASPYYLCHPHVPKRVSNILPDVKLIVLLRNPIERAHSHYNLVKRRGYEKLSFEKAVDAEENRLKHEIPRMIKDDSYFSYKHHKFSYLSRGIYVDQLKAWLKFFPESRLHIIKSEEFLERPRDIIKSIFKYLNLPECHIDTSRIYHKRNNPEIRKETRKKLIAFFKPHNEKLYKYLGKDFGWN